MRCTIENIINTRFTADSQVNLHEAQLATTKAVEIANAGMDALVEADNRLRIETARQDDDVADLVMALQQGQETIPPQNTGWVAIEQLRRNSDVVRQVYDRVAADLAHCREHERNCLDQVRKCAADLAGALLSEQILKLHQLESAAVDMRTRLRACCEFWPEAIDGPPRPLPLTSQAQTILNNPMGETSDPVGPEIREKLRRERQEPLVALFEELVRGNVLADI